MSPTSLFRTTQHHRSTTAPLVLLAMAALSVDSSAQTLSDLSFGTEETFDMVTWNIEWFPKNGQLSINGVRDVIEALDADVLALQEIDDTDDLQDIVDSLPGYEAFYESSWFAGLAYVYDTSTVQVQSMYEIYTTSPYWSPFPRSPVVMELTFNGEEIVVINNHFKCCGDGFLDLTDPGDEEFRRMTASNLLKSYVDTNFADKRVIITGDLNDLLTDQPSNNVFQSFFDAPWDYSFADLAIAQGSSADWSFPNWPSHLDHVLITDELFEEFAATTGAIETIHVEDYLSGGWSQYDSTISDHLPVGIRLPVGDGTTSCTNQVASSETFRMGVPANPFAFIPSPTAPPVVGQVWGPQVNHAVFQPAAILDFVVIATGVTNLPSAMGTILCDLGSANVVLSKAPGDTFAIPIPETCSIAGAPLFAQVASFGMDSVELSNGLDIVIGTF
ncbi:MAG: endonuclease/exonuclease/phosphatase family protein [Planctomycetota bacterium]|jgi:endonuclease/exonuclease/phosphatase family metal-dependent hydrolase